ncbi:MAG TPA: methyl-accepting chemotaxis protein, partial [Geobacteraceae bacterium]
MNWFLDMSTRAKLFIGFGAMVVLLAVMAVTAYWGITEVVVSEKQLYEEEFGVVMRLKDIHANQNGIREGMLAIILTNDRRAINGILQDVEARAKAVDEALPVIRRALRNDAQILAMVDEFDRVRRSFEDIRTKEIVPLLMAGKTEEAKKIVLGPQAERNRQMHIMANKLVDETVANAMEHLRRSEARADQQAGISLAVGLGAVVIGIVLVLILTRIIATPLNRISAVAAQVATGDLTVKLPVEERRDEVGTLGKTFSGMLANVGSMIQEVAEGITVLASAASEIMASTSQVASGATETAAAVSETTTTVEEVKQTAQVTSVKARSVSEAAQKAVQVSQGGRRAVDESV